ncbi:uncharacterized protein LOC110441461 [Mizuhopecten yessoensis]|uniref:Uncharacterized protein n=1 Tax=Mizuhopecten yessoensis TaxID=6573 RepID=A0A210PJD6_MIZYE|nr:uncharacterized protein LOC110441461 [Mizuhopecten yessoensis]XP_021340289.1 uncharacterized protein LOC110441461 [Mizuhopecten yessoensis]OWF36593.1 hypothetical protein KP79_PYT03085 [Mizuhopecten yessoensis]
MSHCCCLHEVTMFSLVLAAMIGISQANTVGPWTPAVPTDTGPIDWTRTTYVPMMTSLAPFYTGTHSTHQHHHHQTTKHHSGHDHTAHPTTHRPVDSNEFDTATFYYDALSHTMVMHLGSCYLMKLSAAQQQSVHTQHGLKSIELSLMRIAVNGQKTKITHDQVVAMSVHLSHMCPSQNNFLLHHVVHHHTTTVRF